MRHPRPTSASGYGKGCTGINFAAGAANAACRYDYPLIHIHNNSDDGNTTERGACGAESQDVLLALNKQNKEYGYVTELNPQTGDFTWETPEGNDYRERMFRFPTNT